MADASARPAVRGVLARAIASWLLVGTVAVAGCGAASSPGASPPVAASPSASPAAAASPSVPPSSSLAPSPTASAVAPSPSGASVPWDVGLLAVLPADVGGLALTPEEEAFAESASDPALVRDAEAGAVALVLDPAAGDYAVTFVYRLRPGVYDEEWFRDWRDSFDQTVCDQAGGKVGNAEAELGGRTVHIGSCVGGVLTYHTHLATDDGDLIVSSQSLGDGRLGEKLMSTLRA